MRRRLASVTVTGLMLATVLFGAVASAQTVESFRDEFGSISYSGNDGSTSFSTSWRERGESDGTGAGVIQVVSSSRCAGGTGNCLRIGSDGDDITGIAIERRADLQDADSASLSFVWRRQVSGSPSTSVRVRISSNGGASWATLATISLKGSQSNQSSSFDIGGYASSSTTIRFEGDGSGSNAYLYIDNVNIDASFPPPTTTSTSTTTAPPTTTTTNPGPGPTTTTTTSPTPSPTSTTTTTEVGTSSTTTTAPTATTTTLAQGGSSSTTTTSAPSTGVDGDDTTTTIAPGSTTPEPQSTDDPTSTVTPDADEPAPEASSSTESTPSAGETQDAAAADEDSTGDAARIVTLIAIQLVVLGSLVAVLAGVGVGGRSGP